MPFSNQYRHFAIINVAYSQQTLRLKTSILTDAELKIRGPSILFEKLD